MNNLSITGRIGKVGELRYTQGGKAVIGISVAVDNGKDANGEKRPATWFEVSIWDKQAEALAQYLVVGDRIGVSGKVKLKVDEGKNGQKYHNLAIDFPAVELLGGSSTPAPAPTQQRTTNRPAARPAGRPAQSQQFEADSSDIPF
jgi:single-strand DNA-binding protein